MSEPRYDVVYHAEHTTIEPHFCREWEDDVGCYGTNPNHGMSFDEACDKVASWYEDQAQLWRSRQHHACIYYSQEEAIPPRTSGETG